MISFSTATGTGVTNPSLPTTDAAYSASVLPFNDDLIVDPANNASVYMAPATWNGASATVIEWYNVRFYTSAASSYRVTFQAWLFYDGRIGFRYLATNTPNNLYNTGGSATIGMQLGSPFTTPTKFVQVR